MRYFVKILFLIAFVLIQTSSGQDQAEIKIYVNHLLKDSTEKIFITGNKLNLGNWNPSEIVMNKLNDSSWMFTSEFQIGDTIEFKFTKGSWNSEAVSREGIRPSNNKLIIMKDTALKFNVEKWKSDFAKSDVYRVKGQLEIIKDVKYKGLLPRDVLIWLPPSYNKMKNKRYPVLYMQDGQNVFDPTTSFSGDEWEADETADSLIKKRKIKEIIIIGINNTQDRIEEYTDTEKGKLYTDFIVKYLKPMIDKKYRTLKGKSYNAICGSSAGAVISMLTAWRNPDIFSMVGALSPAFKVLHINIIPVIKDTKKPPKLKIYITNGEKEERLQPGAEEMVKVLKEKGYKKGSNLIWKIIPKGIHNEKDWAKVFPDMVRYFFGIN